jgi:hypothetical protein
MGTAGWMGTEVGVMDGVEKIGGIDVMEGVEGLEGTGRFVGAEVNAWRARTEGHPGGVGLMDGMVDDGC